MQVPAAHPPTATGTPAVAGPSPGTAATAPAHSAPAGAKGAAGARGPWHGPSQDADGALAQKRSTSLHSEEGPPAKRASISAPAGASD